MATVNKNFRVKNGLVVEGSTATVNGFDILTKASTDQSYIIDLIGGTATSANTANTVVKRDANGNFAAGTITANAITLDGNDLAGLITAAQTAAENYADGLASNYDAAGSAATAESNANDYTDDRELAITTAYEAYADQAEADAIATAAADATSKANAAQAAAEATAAADATSKANAAQAAAEATAAADATTKANAAQAAAAADATTKANAAQAAAEAYADALTTDDVAEGSSNLYFSNGLARNAISVDESGLTYDNSTGIFGVASNTFEAYGAASAAEAAANSYTNDREAAITTAYEAYADQAESDAISAAALDATTKANAAQAAAESYADGLAANYDIAGAAAQALSDANDYTDTAVSNLVAGAPELLDTLNELAAAIADNPNYATDVANLISTKADTSYVDSEISDLDTALRSYADTAEADAKSYADGLASNYDAAGSAAAAQTAAEGYADGLAGDILDGTSDFTALDVNSVSRQIAATTGNISTAAATTALSWASASYRTAKILVKAKNGSHTHVSEVIVSLDTSDNIALNEYAITTTNGSLMTIDADIDGGNVRLRVTPANNNTEVMAHATLLV